MNYDVLEDYSLIELHSERIPASLPKRSVDLSAFGGSRPAGLQGIFHS